MRVVLLGDSHLARVRRDLARIAPDVVNAAVGGAAAADVRAQAAGADVTCQDVAVVSVGTNDAGWRGVDPASFAHDLTRLVAEVSPRHWVYVAPPLGDEPFTELGCAVFHSMRASIVETAHLLAPLGGTAFTEDGIHLTGAAYAVLLPAIAAAVAI